MCLRERGGEGGREREGRGRAREREKVRTLSLLLAADLGTPFFNFLVFARDLYPITLNAAVVLGFVSICFEVVDCLHGARGLFLHEARGFILRIS